MHSVEMELLTNDKCKKFNHLQLVFQRSPVQIWLEIVFLACCTVSVEVSVYLEEGNQETNPNIVSLVCFFVLFNLLCSLKSYCMNE